MGGEYYNYDEDIAIGSIVKNNGTIVILKEQMLDTVAKVATEEGVLPNDLLAICIQESGCNPQAIRNVPGELSIGAMQINMTVHRRGKTEPQIKELEECAKDLECSMRWTAQRLKATGYNYDLVRTRRYSIHAHNGISQNVDNSWYPVAVLKYSKELEKYFERL